VRVYSKALVESDRSFIAGPGRGCEIRLMPEKAPPVMPEGAHRGRARRGVTRVKPVDAKAGKHKECIDRRG